MTALSPRQAWRVLADHNAPLRLIRHAQFVHDAAQKLTHGLEDLGFTLPTETILAGAILHDIGKVQHPAELDHPGKLHEAAGELILQAAGIPSHLAQIARTHGTRDPHSLKTPDLIVALADKLWKGKRASDFELALIDRMATETQQSRWDLFGQFDDLFETIAAGGAANLLDSQGR